MHLPSHCAFRQVTFLHCELWGTLQLHASCVATFAVPVWVSVLWGVLSAFSGGLRTSFLHLCSRNSLQLSAFSIESGLSPLLRTHH